MNTPEPARYQCRRIHVDGRRCGSPCLRGEEFCYFHHTTRTPAKLKELAERERLRETFALPLPEDRSAIQHGIGQVLQRIASNNIDPRRAGLLLYGLQIASLNLPKERPLKRHEEPEIVEEIIEDPELGLLAPQLECEEAGERLSTTARILKEWAEEKKRQAQSATLPSIQACEEAFSQTQTAEKPAACSPHLLSTHYCLLSASSLRRRPSHHLHQVVGLDVPRKRSLHRRCIERDILLRRAHRFVER